MEKPGENLRGRGHRISKSRESTIAHSSENTWVHKEPQLLYWGVSPWPESKAQARAQTIDPRGPEQGPAVCQMCCGGRNDQQGKISETSWVKGDGLLLSMATSVQSYSSGNPTKALRKITSDFWMKLWTHFWRVSMIGHHTSQRSDWTPEQTSWSAWSAGCLQDILRKGSGSRWC